MRAHVIGLGLIGGSIGIALRRAGWQVGYTDPNVAVDDARAAGAADETARGDADVTIIATPVDVAVGLVREQRDLATSVCSVMQPLRAAAAGKTFVAGHPLAGSAERGLRAASGDLFRGKRWFVDAQDPIVDRVIADCGARRELVNAEEHDAAVALTSHLPQILSTALAAYLEDRDLTRFAGSGLATFLRLAASDASVWRPIIDANRQNVEAHVEPLVAIVKQIIEGDDSAFKKAQRLLQRIANSE